MTAISKCSADKKALQRITDDQAFLPTAAKRPIRPSLTIPISSTSR